jgi:2-dehydropantoate 2-reductase
MRICVVGAGAIGGLLGADLALAGRDPTIVEVGAQLEAIQEGGLEIRSGDGDRRVAHGLRATDSFEEAGPQDLVVLAVKSQVIPRIADRLPALLGSDTTVVTVQNGLPWWYFQRHGGPLEGLRLDTVDPGGRVTEAVAPERIVGCIAYPAALLERPGVVRHLYGRSFPVGELDGSDTARLQALRGLFADAGYKSWTLDDVRAELWLKLVGVLAFNPISALTHATMGEICSEPEARAVVVELMREAESVASALGVTLRVSVERRLEGAARVGDHRTSMLQDVEAGRSLEVDALLGAVLEVGREVGVSTPRIESLYAYTRLLDHTLARRGTGIGAVEAAAGA